MSFIHAKLFMEREGIVCLPFLSKGIVPVILSVLSNAFVHFVFWLALLRTFPFLGPKV